MTCLAGDVLVRLVRRDNTAQRVLSRARWSMSALRSRIPETVITADECDTSLDVFEPWCDFIEYYFDDALAMRYLLQGQEPVDATTRTIRGSGLAAQLNRRRVEHETTYDGPATGIFAHDMMSAADGVQQTFMTVTQPGAVWGALLSPTIEAEETLLSLHDLLVAHVVYTEHSGGTELRAVGDELDGPDLIRRDWLTLNATATPALDAALMMNEVAVRYGPDLEEFAYWPPGRTAVGPSRCRLQGPAFKFPEIAAHELAEASAVAGRIFSALANPRVVLPELDLEPAAVTWPELVPGRWSVSGLPGSEGERCNLDSVVVEGLGNRVSSVRARYDQSDVSLLLQRAAS